MAAGTALIPFAADSMPLLAVLAFPLGFAQGAIVPTFSAMLFKRCSPHKRGAASSAFFVAVDVGFGVGALILGALAEIDPRYGFWVTAVLIMVAMALYPLISDKRYNAKQGIT